MPAGNFNYKENMSEKERDRRVPIKKEHISGNGSGGGDSTGY
jgi:hypothetical protein